MKGSRFITLAAVVAASLLVGCVSGISQQEMEMSKDFTLRDIRGNNVRLSEFRGRVVILDFFADWCPPCRQEIPDFISLERQYGAEGLSVIGVAVVGEKDAAAFAKEMGIGYPVLVDDGSASELYGPIRSIPTTFVIDKVGRIARKYIGFRPRSVFEADVKELLK